MPATSARVAASAPGEDATTANSFGEAYQEGGVAAVGGEGMEAADGVPYAGVAGFVAADAGAYAGDIPLGDPGNMYYGVGAMMYGPGMYGAEGAYYMPIVAKPRYPLDYIRSLRPGVVGEVPATCDVGTLAEPDTARSAHGGAPGKKGSGSRAASRKSKGGRQPPRSPSQQAQRAASPASPGVSSVSTAPSSPATFGGSAAGSVASASDSPAPQGSPASQSGGISFGGPGAWRPRRVVQLDPAEAASRKVRSLLNKLTPENFDRLVPQFLAVVLPTAEALQAVTEVVFAKACDERGFSDMYALLCSRLADGWPERTAGSGAIVSFQRLLLAQVYENLLCNQSSEQSLDVVRYPYPFALGIGGDPSAPEEDQETDVAAEVFASSRFSSNTKPPARPGPVTPSTPPRRSVEGATASPSPPAVLSPSVSVTSSPSSAGGSPRVPPSVGKLDQGAQDSALAGEQRGDCDAAASSPALDAAAADASSDDPAVAQADAESDEDTLSLIPTPRRTPALRRADSAPTPASEQLHRKTVLANLSAANLTTPSPGGESATTDVTATTSASYAERQKLMGNMVLLGRLFQHGLLTSNIVHMCVARFLDFDTDEDAPPPPEDDVEAVCALFKAIGAQLDSASPASRAAMGDYVAALAELMDHPLLSSRLRFLIMDTLELRHNNWTLRESQKVVDPKKLSELREEAIAAGNLHSSPRSSPKKDRSSGRQHRSGRHTGSGGTWRAGADFTPSPMVRTASSPARVSRGHRGGR